MTSPDVTSRVLSFLAALERGAEPDELATYLHPQVRQREHPNPAKPYLADRGLPEILAGAVAGRRFLSGQRYDVDDVLVCGEQVVLRLRWTGTLAADFQSLRPGQELRAHVAMFVTVRDGRIVDLASYDCYEPFDASSSGAA